MFELLTVLKDQIQSNAKARTLLSDSITLLGQAQFNLSLRRRYIIRPYLKKKYANLCNINTPITSFLFGDDVQKEIRKCDTSMSVTKEQYNFYGPQRMRGRARGTCLTYCTKTADNKIYIWCYVQAMYHIENSKTREQTVQIQMKQLILSCLIWIYTVCKFTYFHSANLFHFYGGFKLTYFSVKVLLLRSPPPEVYGLVLNWRCSSCPSNVM